MAVRIRLSRHGKKGYAFYHIVVANSRAPRDGKFIEKLGVYDPNQKPAHVNFNFERALHWVQTGAVPTDTCRSLLSHLGVMYKNHLLKGVKKGAMSLEQAESKFNLWKEQKDLKLRNEREQLLEKQKNLKKKQFEAETKVREAKALAIAKKKTAVKGEGSENTEN